MEQKPVVSIITPCYNSEAYIERYLKNILSQTYSCIELITVNDGSTDATEDIIKRYIKEFERKGYSLIYVKQENMGLGGAINTALKYITGEFFTWCDSDNFYTADYFETKIEFFLKNPKYSIVRCDGFIVSEKDIEKPIGLMAAGNTDKFQENMFENCLYVKNFHFGCAMLRTSDFDKINPTREIYPSRAGQNWQLLLPMFYHYKSGYIDKPMFYFVERADSVSNCVKKQSIESQYRQKEEYCRIILKTIKRMNFSGSEKYARDIKIKYSIQCFLIAMGANDKKRLDEEYKKLKKLQALNKGLKEAYKRERYGIIYKINELFRRKK